MKLTKVSIDDRLDTMDANLDHLMLANVRNVVPRLDNIEAEIRVLQYSAGKMNEWLSRAEHRVNELQEKIDAID